jgi:N-acetylglucosaminyl-diphospho-decaprenol L-rhamnosyltransferase
MDVEFVITHYQSPERLRLCLAALADSGLSGAQVVVVDSAASPPARRVVEETLPAARYVAFSSNVGFSALVNAGLARTQSPYVLIMNADVTVSEQVVSALALHLDDNPDVGMVGPRISHVGGALQYTAFAFYRPETILARRTAYGRSRRGHAELQRFTMRDEIEASIASSRPLDVDWLMGACFLLRRTAYNEIGPMDVSYFLYFEDVDYCARLWRADWKVNYLPHVQAEHVWGRGSAKTGFVGTVFNKLAWMHLRSGVRYFSRYGFALERPTSSNAVRDPA